MLTKSQIEDIYPLAPMQSGMLFHNLQDNQSYIIQTGYIIEGPLSVATFEESINRLVARHEVLRTAFIYEVGDAPLQVVLKERKLEVHFEDIENVADQEACIGQFKRDCKAKGFNLTKDVLMRMSILKLATNKHMLIWTFHHILMDGWCVSVIIDEFSTIYYSLMSKKPFTLSPTVPYKQYITWIKQRDEQQSLSFWKSYLDQYENPVRIPGLGRPGKKQQVFDQKIASHSFDSQRVRQLKAYAQERKVTFNMVIQAIWGIALAKYSDTNDALFGSVVSGRPSEIAGIDTSVGLFINTIPVRVRYGEGTTFNQLIQNLWQESVEAQQHQYLSLANVQKESDLSQDAINSLYVFENYPDLQDLTQDNETPDSADMLTFTKQRMSEQNNYDMTLVAFTKGDALQLRIEYNSEVFEDAPMANMLQHLDHMVYQVLDNDEVLVEDISLLAPADHEEILANCHSELDDSIQYTSIQETFEACVAQHPEAIAIKYYENELTYDEFNKRVNKIAKHLKKEYDLGTNDSVGILLTEPDQMIMAIFAILKTGAAYVPVEEEWPAERKGMVVADAGINLLVTDVVSFLDVSEFYSGNIFLFESFSIEIDDFSDDNLAIASTKDDLAYVMYTSGSTGIPKGIAVEQRSVVSLVRDSSLVSVKTGDRVLQLSNFAFDGSTFDIYAALLNGGTLMLLSKETVLSHALLEKYLAKYQPNITFITTSLFNTLIDLNPQQFSRFDRVHIGGEHLSLAHMMRAFDHQQREGILVNSYGPTEGTTFSNFYEIKSKDAIAQLNTVPIGKPLTNRFAYVLNKDGGLCPYFVPGELHIGGVGLFREYLNNEVLNSEKLIPNPFNAEEKIYKTGDEAMMLPDGNIVYLGRKDEQIKLRGFRIELGEIEGCLMQLPNINNAVALVIKEQDKGDVIVAYYQSTQEVSRELIVGELSRKLPSYMIPGEFIRIDQIPLTRNGKADKKLLATMERGADRKHIAPQNEIEQQLLSIWEEVLKSQEKIGVTDSFFDCGGDSILAIKLVVRMNKAFSTNHNINSVFSNPTIRQFAAFLEEATAGPTMSPMVPVDEASYYEASHGQKRMWLLNKFDDTGSAYNIAVTYEIEGALDQEVFAQAWKALIERHESLRTVFTEIDGEPHQIVQAYGSQYAPHFLNLEGEMGQVIDATVSSIAETALDLENGPLSMAVVLQTSGDNDILCLVFHHIVTDGWSMQVIFQELLKNYQNILYGKWNGQENRPMQYKDYTAWLNSPDNQKAFQEQKDYWLQKFSGEVPTLNLISDYPRPKVKTYNGDVVRFELDAVQTSRLNALGDQTEATLFMQLTAMLHLLLHQYSGQNDIVTGTPNAGRHTEEMESMVGFFLNTLCIRTRLNPDVTYADYLKAVKQEVLDIFNNQFYPFDQLVSDLQLSRDTARSPLFDVMVVLQNQNKVGNISDTQMGGLNLSDYPVERSTSHFDLTFEFSETADGLRGAIIYNTDLFTKQRIEQVAVHFKTLTQLILDNTKARLKDISHIPAAERTQLLETFNDTKRAFPEDKTLLDLFAEQVRQQPDQVALVFEDQEYTFEALNAKSNQYGRSLQQRIKIEAGDLVGILMDRTDHMIISILATLKLGAVYLPLDIEAPAERLKKQLENSGLKGIVTDAAHAALAET